MGQALLNGWLKDGLGPIAIVEPDAATVAPFLKRGKISWVSSLAELAPGFHAQTIVLAVKPQMIEAVSAPLRTFVTSDTLILSILAGISVASLSRLLGSEKIVRVMPNLPASIGRAVSVATAQAGITSAQRDSADDLLRAVGRVEWIDDEALIDPITAVSGSGPAYVFLLVEILAAAGVKAGLAPDLAMTLARETVTGAAELMHRSDQPASELRRNVSSPGGTTIAALSVLTADNRLQSLFDEAIEAAAERARELGR
jgi:pyrroline-5-carboxylate reductase